MDMKIILLIMLIIEMLFDSVIGSRVVIQKKVFTIALILVKAGEIQEVGVNGKMEL